MRKVVRCVRRGAIAVLLILVLCLLTNHYDKSIRRKVSLISQLKQQPVIDEHLIKPSKLTFKTQEGKTNTTAPKIKKETALSSDLEDVTFETEDMKDEHGELYKIVIWKNLPGKPGYLANPEVCLGNVECDISYDTSNVHKAHAVVFPADSISNQNLPSTRHPWQHYVWWTLESPLHTGGLLDDLDNFFNLTFHYRLDADVYAPYGSINLILRELAHANEGTIDDLLATKRRANKMAAWAVSNCYNKRIAYAKSIMDAGLPVDTFGACFGGKEIGNGKYSESFYQQLSQYRFYFSFENSVDCKDYFTEKFWFNGLRSGAVPIVWGSRKSDLLKVAPSHSFIHANDYSSPEELVAYLKYLASNETAYAEYLQWRTWKDHPERIETHLRMENRDNDLRSFCKLCAIVQADGRRRKRGQQTKVRVVPSLTQSWLGTEQGLCHR